MARRTASDREGATEIAIQHLQRAALEGIELDDTRAAIIDELNARDIAFLPDARTTSLFHSLMRNMR